MSVTNPTRKKDAVSTTDRQRSVVELLARSFTLGTDKEGYSHHYYQPADAVVVYDGRDLDHVEHLNGRLLATWRDYVAQKRGWAIMGPHANTGIQHDTQRKTRGGA